MHISRHLLMMKRQRKCVVDTHTHTIYKRCKEDTRYVLAKKMNNQNWRGRASKLNRFAFVLVDLDCIT